LASSSKDKTICIWNVESETRVKELTLPAPMSHLTDSQKKRLNLALTWLPKRNQLIVSSYRGDLLTFDSDHAKTKFNRFTNDVNSHNRSVIKIISYPCAAILAIDPTKIAFASNEVHVWDYASEDGLYDNKDFYKVIKFSNNATCVKWHPYEEGVLAFGTNSGMVGFFNIYQNGNNSTVFKSYHKGEVTSLQWCKSEWIDLPINNKKDSDMYLLSCSLETGLLLNIQSSPRTVSYQIDNFIK
ncbi:357_t:CDS:2, partial [Entrophospora sp. SA101]